MFKERNRRACWRQSFLQTTPAAKKRELGQKKKIGKEEEPTDDGYDEESRLEQEKMMEEARIQAWQRYEHISQRALHKQDRTLRNHILSVLLFDVQLQFNLKLRTIQHTIKLLDLFESIRDRNSSSLSKGSNILYKKGLTYPEYGTLMRDLVTCFFMSCKYNQIYPPSLYDLVDAIHSTCKTETIIKNEIQVLETLNLNMNVALPSDWYKMINKTVMPIWCYLCYLDFDLKDKSKFIAEEINLFIGKILGSKDPKVYELVKLHEKSQKGNFQITKEEALKIYQAFVQFRLDRKVGKLTLDSETKENDSKSSRTITIKSMKQSHMDNI